MKRPLLPALGSLVLFLAGCGTAYADRVAVNEHHGPLAVTPDSPYELELIGENGQTMPTFNKGGRYYVLGQVGARYSIRVTNPTDHRVEAVVSVDGLDVIDGESGDYIHKRGYVVPPRGELVIPGWRVSTQQVAAFRFSSVAGSYAGRKGKARNVGVIGVAIFEERGEPQVIVQNRRYDRRPPPVHRRRLGGGVERDEEAPAAEPPSAADSAGAAGRGKAVSRSRAPSRPVLKSGESCCHVKKRRPGLGTEFGERRNSAVGFTRFVRKHPRRPDATATLRYNDSAGLRALGILVEPEPDADELVTRETADPFPGTHFAEPPR